MRELTIEETEQVKGGNPVAIGIGVSTAVGGLYGFGTAVSDYYALHGYNGTATVGGALMAGAQGAAVGAVGAFSGALLTVAAVEGSAAMFLGGAVTGIVAYLPSHVSSVVAGVSTMRKGVVTVSAH